MWQTPTIELPEQDFEDEAPEASTAGAVDEDVALEIFDKFKISKEVRAAYFALKS